MQRITVIQLASHQSIRILVIVTHITIVPFPNKEMNTISADISNVMYLRDITYEATQNTKKKQRVNNKIAQLIFWVLIFKEYFPIFSNIKSPIII